MTDTTKQKTELIMKIISESGLDAYGTPDEFTKAIELAIGYGTKRERARIYSIIANMPVRTEPMGGQMTKYVQQREALDEIEPRKI